MAIRYRVRPLKSAHVTGVMPAKRLWPLSLTILVLPFSYVPHELIRGGPSISVFVLALILISGAYYGVLGRRLGAIDTTVLLCAAYLAVRLAVIAPLQTRSGIDFPDLLSSVGALLAGVVLFRIARQPELRPTIVRSLKWLVVLLLAMEAYQIAVGLPRLFALGYQEGFYYYTEGGSYRPFGPFLSPTVFGAYLAVVGAAVIMASRGKRAGLWFVAVAVGLVFTETRAAQIAFAVAMLATVAFISPAARRRAIQFAIPAAFVALIVVLANPALLGGQLQRLATLTDSSYTSNSSRIQLWTGAIEAAKASPVVGYPADAFVNVLAPIIGTDAAYGHAHSNYLQVLFEQGVFGLAFFLTILVLGFVGIRRHVKTGSPETAHYAAAGLAALLAFVVDSFFETSWTSMNVVVTVLLLVGLGMAGRPTKPGRLSSAALKAETPVPHPLA